MKNKGESLVLNTYRTAAVQAVVLTGKLSSHDEKITEAFMQLPPMHAFLLKDILNIND